MYEFNISYNGLELNFLNGFIVQEIQGLDNPEMRISRDDLTGIDGGNIWARLYAMRGIVINGTVFGNTADEFFTHRGQLVRAFNKESDDWFQVTLWNGQSRRINAKSISMPEMPLKEAMVTDGTFRLEVLAEDPYWQDVSEYTNTAVLAVPTGLTIPFLLPATLTVTDLHNIITVDNIGDTAVYPYLRITGEVNHAKVTNITTGEQFELTVRIYSGDIVELFVDTEGKTVLYNSTQKYWQYLDGKFITLQKGVNQIVFTASEYNAQAQLFMRWSNKYESIQ